MWIVLIFSNLPYINKCFTTVKSHILAFASSKMIQLNRVLPSDQELAPTESHSLTRGRTLVKAQTLLLKKDELSKPLRFHTSYLRCNETLSWRRADQRDIELQPPDLLDGRNGRRSRDQSGRQSDQPLAGMGDPDPPWGQVAREVPGGATKARNTEQNCSSLS